MAFRHNKLKKGERCFEREAVFRDFVYRAFVDKHTGRLIRVTAGCRNWPDFSAAHRHYKGEDLGRHWADTALMPPIELVKLQAPVQDFLDSKALRTYVTRAEVRKILLRLEATANRFRSKRWRINQRHRVEKMRANRMRAGK